MRKKLSIKTIVPVIAVLFIVISLIIGFVIYSPSTLIEKYDTVEIDYTVWESDENENYDSLNPILETVLWVSMIPITENETTGIILGLYNNLLGKNRFYESGLVWLNRCIDQDRDGINDNTGQPALTYGNSADLYFDTCLMIQFTILNIQKAPSSIQPTDVEIIILTVIVITVMVVLIGTILAVSGYYIHRYLKLRKKKSKRIKKRHYTWKELVLKYGILGGLMTSITFFLIWIINWYFPFSLILQYTPEALWVIVLLILVVWVLFIFLYLIIYKIIRNKRIDHLS